MGLPSCAPNGRKTWLRARATVLALLLAVSLPAGAHAQAERTQTTAKAAPAPSSSEEVFRLGYLGPFKEALRGPSKVYSLTGLPPERVMAGPLFVVSTDRSDAPSVKVAAQLAFKLIGGFRDHAEEYGKEVVMGGMPGYSIIGRASEIKSGDEIGIYFVMLKDLQGNYHVMIGTVPVDDMPIYIPEFQKMAGSLKVRNQQ